jgi:hypothetical protein
MNFEEHREISRKTWHKKDKDWYSRLQHSILGLIDETGEISSCLKKEIGYGKELDLVNMKEEIGDKIYFLQRVLDESQLTEKGMNQHISLDDCLHDIEPFIKSPFQSICQLAFESSVLAIQTANRTDPRYVLSNTKIIIDRPNIVRILRCLVELINHYGFTISEVLEANINKLKIRYGKELEFTQEKAINRNLTKEKEALNGK